MESSTISHAIVMTLQTFICSAVFVCAVTFLVGMISVSVSDFIKDMFYLDDEELEDREGPDESVSTQVKACLPTQSIVSPRRFVEEVYDQERDIQDRPSVRAA